MSLPDKNRGEVEKLSQSCCENKSSEINELRNGQRNILVIVLIINASMFFIEFSAGWFSRSSALMADSLDMFGDSIVYAFSLCVLDRGVLWRARAGLLKGVIMTLFGVFVLAQTGYHFVQGLPPVAETMGVVGSVALAANLICLLLLYRHRRDDVNMRSTWLCSRNDIVANLGVLAATGLVVITGSIWPDTVIGLAIAGLFFKSSLVVIAESRQEAFNA